MRPIAAFGLLALSIPASAGQVAVPRDALCGIADTVALVSITHVETRWAAGDGIERIARATVERVLRGDKRASFDVTLPGGTLGELTHWVEDVPKLAAGVRYVLFLDPAEKGWTVVGGEAGAVRIASERSWRGEPIAPVLAELGGCLAR